MVVGNDLMVKMFGDYNNRNNIIVLTSVVSNYMETNPWGFQREWNLLKDTLQLFPSFKFLYFSAYGIEEIFLQGQLFYKIIKNV